tara:strand:+ start:506 stop:1435 length:930 start_codon:yes stop_codon:yes gene_type:complete
MNEKLITINNIDITKLFGINNHKLNKIKMFFPEIKIIARGEVIKVIGNNKEINLFENKILTFIKHIEKYNNITLNQIERIIQEKETEILNINQDVILHGKNGRLIKARTINQRKMLLEINKNDMLFAIGPAGTGKTYTAVAIAVKALKKKQVKKIIFTRPAIEAGENLGFLPGDLKEKLDPYMQPIYDALSDMIPAKKLDYYIEEGIIQIAPLAFMRGRTLDNAFVILDEGQNTTDKQMKMFLTRMGMAAKFIITGDTSQIDLVKNNQSGLLHAQKKLASIKGISFIKLNDKDVIRHKLVKQIINAYKI